MVIKRFDPARLAALAMLTLPSLSHALSVQISDGATTFTCADGTACEVGVANADGVMTFSQSVGSWLASITTGVSKPAVGSSLAPSLQLTHVSVSGNFSGSAPPLTIKLSERGFTTPNAVNAFSFSSAAILNGMTATVQAYADNNNTLFGTGTALGASPVFQDPNPLDSASASFSHNAQVAGNTVQPFSLTLIAQLSNPALGVRSSSVSGTLSLVPLPAAFWLFGSAIAGIGALGRKRAAMA